MALQPANLDLPTLLARAGLTKEWRTKKKGDKLACAVHIVMEAAHRDFRNEGGQFWIPLHSRRLEAILGKRYATAVFSTLQQLGVLEVNRRYSSRRFPMSYRLATIYRAAPAVLRPIADTVLARNLREGEDIRTQEALGENADRAAVWQNLQSVTLADETAAFLESRRDMSPAAQASRTLTFRDFSRRWFWLRADEATGRIFHNVTQCPRELRPFLRINGEETAEVDIGGAQPFFGLSLYPAGHPEREDYARAVTSDDFYAELFNHMPRETRRSWGSDASSWTSPGTTHRDRFKRHTLRHVFYDVSADNPPTVFTAFAEAFPWLAGELALRRATKAGAADLARQLQRKEADLVVHRAVPRIQREITGCQPVTIHDGILCQRRFAEKVRAIVEDECGKAFGVEARVRIKSAQFRAAA